MSLETSVEVSVIFQKEYFFLFFKYFNSYSSVIVFFIHLVKFIPFFPLNFLWRILLVVFIFIDICQCNRNDSIVESYLLERKFFCIMLASECMHICMRVHVNGYILNADAHTPTPHTFHNPLTDSVLIFLQFK